MAARRLAVSWCSRRAVAMAAVWRTWPQRDKLQGCRMAEEERKMLHAIIFLTINARPDYKVRMKSNADHEFHPMHDFISVCHNKSRFILMRHDHEKWTSYTNKKCSMSYQGKGPDEILQVARKRRDIAALDFFLLGSSPDTRQGSIPSGFSLSKDASSLL
ncbi:hypothetical protein SAY87_002115 [Trapa incisa]|uniref:Uncharacterized protein n=1 Tax=Trapa incisa TaxID=236973 RepID=A0AAN7JTM3_9MYRT|nr:hypothetical protein SAY87_002115 [Trapa incisa]